jgi:hypothetical protein
MKTAEAADELSYSPHYNWFHHACGGAFSGKTIG